MTPSLLRRALTTRPSTHVIAACLPNCWHVWCGTCRCFLTGARGELDAHSAAVARLAEHLRDEHGAAL